jgi:hypothetical protein
MSDKPPTPWSWQFEPINQREIAVMRDRDGNKIAEFSNYHHAEYIFDIVNSHAALVDALEAANNIIAILERENPKCYDLPWDTNDFISGQARNNRVDYYKGLISAALAAAKGEK